MEHPLTPTDTTPRGARRTSKRLVAAGLGAGLLAGSAIGLFVAVPSLTSAASSTDGTVVVEQDDGTTTDVPSDMADPGTRLRDVLQPLVDDGTISAEQADAVSTYLASQRPDRGDRGQGGPGGHHGRGHEFGAVVTDLLGIDGPTLRAELEAGSTLAEVAEAHGVDAQTLIDALVADAETHIAQAVENGRLTEDEAAAKLADLEQRITDRVNGETTVPADAG